jgi:hypothetical protein
MSLSRIAVVCLVLTLLLLTAVFALVIFRKDAAARWVSDDGYYAVAVSRNVAMGRGVTIDGATLTNGFQPFFTFLSAAVYALVARDKLTEVRLVVVLNFVFYLGTALLLGMLFRNCVEARRRKVAFWAATFFYLGGFVIYQVQFTGMETPFLLFMYALVWWYFQSNRLESFRDLLLLGLLLGCLILARVDTIFLVALLSLYLLGDRKYALSVRLVRSMLVGLVAVAVSLPWWLYNLEYFGSLVPSGGRAQQAWAFSLERIRFAFIGVLSDLVPWLFAFRGVNLVRLALVSLALFFIWKKRRAVARFLYGQESLHQRARRAVLFGLCQFAATSILVVWYTLSSFATWHYARYFSPFFLPATLLLAALFLYASERLPQILIKALMVMGIIWPAWMLYAHNPPNPNEMFEQLELVEKYVPQGEEVGAEQSGTLGFFRDRVVNLDGKVNVEALQYRRAGPEGNSIWKYLETRRIKWFCDWPAFALRNLGETPAAHGWTVLAASEHFVLYYNPQEAK